MIEKTIIIYIVFKSTEIIFKITKKAQKQCRPEQT